MICGSVATGATENTGLILVNGEFGKRIATQARRAGMCFTVLEISVGTAFDTAAVLRGLNLAARRLGMVGASMKHLLGYQTGWRNLRRL